MAKKSPNVMQFVKQGFNKDFFPNFGVRGQLNFNNGQKWSFETLQTGIQILIECKLLVLGLSNMA